MTENNLEEKPLRRSKKTVETAEDTGFSRTKTRQKQKLESQAEKTKQLARKLNYAIIGLIVAIILVFLFMRFVKIGRASCRERVYTPV